MTREIDYDKVRADGLDLIENLVSTARHLADGGAEGVDFANPDLADWNPLAVLSAVGFFEGSLQYLRDYVDEAYFSAYLEGNV